MGDGFLLYTVCIYVCVCVHIRLRGENGSENEIMGERKVELSKIKKTDFPVLLDSM